MKLSQQAEDWLPTLVVAIVGLMMFGVALAALFGPLQ
jgi:hypothetical protein